MTEEQLSVGPFKQTLEDLKALNKSLPRARDGSVAGWILVFSTITGFVTLFVIGINLLLLALHLTGTPQPHGGALFLEILAGGVAYSLFTFLYWEPGVMRQTFEAYRWGEGDITVTISPLGVQSTFRKGVSKYPWTEVERIIVSDRHVFLQIAPMIAPTIPANAFASAQEMSRFVACAQEWHAAAHTT